MNSTHITDWLDKHYPCRYKKNHKSFTNLKLFNPDCEKRTLHSDILYITEYPIETSEMQKASFLLVCNNMNTVSTEDYYVVVEAAKAKEVFTSLKDWWNEKSKIQDILLELYYKMNNKNHLESIIDIAFTYLQNPISITNHQHQLIINRQAGRVTPIEWQSLIDAGRFPIDLVNDVFYEGYYKMIQTKEPVLFKLKDGSRVYLCPIRYNNIYMGAVSLLENKRPITEFDLEILDALARISSSMLNQTSLKLDKDNYNKGLIIHDILKGKITSEYELEYRMKIIEWTPSTNYRIILLKSKNHRQVLKHVKKSFSYSYPDIANMIIEDDTILAVEEKNIENEPAGNLRNFCQHFDTYCSVSQVFHNLIHLTYYYRQAQFVLGLINETDSFYIDKHVFYYQDFILEDLVSRFEQSDSNATFQHPVLREIKHYDAENDTSFSSTLYAYISHNKSTGKAAQMLYLHKNTVNYRIQKIKKLFHIDFNNFYELVHIYLSYKLETISDEKSFTIQ